MRFKHKALAYLMALTLLCSGTYTRIYAEEAVSSDSPAVSEEGSRGTTRTVPENVKNLLSILGLMNEMESDAAGYVSRGFAAEILLRFDKTYAGGTAAGNIYEDVSEETMYAYEIEASTKCGYFFGIGEGKFDPETSITPMQMAMVLLRMAGYPERYIQTSSECTKLMRGLENYDYLTYPDLANMLYTFLETNVVVYDGAVYGNMTISSETVLNSFFDIYKFEGIVTENDVTGLWSGTDLKENR